MSRRRRKQRLKKVAAGSVAAVILLGILAGVALSTGRFDPARNSKACVVADLSRSTRQARSHYVREFEAFSKKVGEQTSGELCLIVAGRNSLTDGTPLYTSVAPSGPRNDVGAAGEIRAAVAAASAGYEQLLEDPPLKVDRSELIEAAVLAGDVLERGDRLLFLSDGFQFSDSTGSLKRVALGPAEIEGLLNRLESEDLIADLDGVTVSFPLLLFSPGGVDAGAAQNAAVRAFWLAWIERTGAELEDSEETAGRFFE